MSTPFILMSLAANDAKVEALVPANVVAFAVAVTFVDEVIALIAFATAIDRKSVV
jgi:hypothetical protein